jgi:putative monooxygenase
MPIINPRYVLTEEAYPGVERIVLASPAWGSRFLWIARLTLEPGSQVDTHYHPNSEEAMTIVEGNLEAILGDEVVTLGPGDTVLAPPGVKHGFINRSPSQADLLAAFPTISWERVVTE